MFSIHCALDERNRTMVGTVLDLDGLHNECLSICGNSISEHVIVLRRQFLILGLKRQLIV